jgi:hypothetical protein
LEHVLIAELPGRAALAGALVADVFSAAGQSARTNPAGPSGALGP